MKRFALFMGHNYYPGRAWEDFQHATDTLEEALAFQRGEFDWYQVVDLSLGEVVASGNA